MSSKKTWGNACWYLFHTLAYKLNNNNPDVIVELLDNIISICRVLPCPDCAQHATDTLKKLNKQNVRTKEDLIKVLLEFHNIVNKRVGKVLFTREQHDELYKTGNLPAMYNNFMTVMYQNVKSERAMMYNMARKQVLSSFEQYINDNKHNFNI